MNVDQSLRANHISIIVSHKQNYSTKSLYKPPVLASYKEMPSIMEFSRVISYVENILSQSRFSGWSRVDFRQGQEIF
jgi:hypothetical protein